MLVLGLNIGFGLNISCSFWASCLFLLIQHPPFSLALLRNTSRASSCTSKTSQFFMLLPVVILVNSLTRGANLISHHKRLLSEDYCYLYIFLPSDDLELKGEHEGACIISHTQSSKAINDACQRIGSVLD